MLKPIVPQIIRPALKQPALKACLFINSISSTPFNHFKKQTYKLTYWLVYPHSAHTNKPIDRHPVVFLCLKLNNISSHLLNSYLLQRPVFKNVPAVANCKAKNTAAEATALIAFSESKQHNNPSFTYNLYPTNSA